MGRIGSSFAPLRRSALLHQLHRSAPLTSFADRHTRILLPPAVNPLLCGLNSSRTIQKKAGHKNRLFINGCAFNP